MPSTPASLTAQLEAFKAAGHRRRRDHAHLRRARRRGSLHPVPVGRVDEDARPHAPRGARGSTSASTWPPARAGRSAGRGSATTTSPRTIAHKTWVLGGGERLTEPVRLRQTPLVRALGNQIHVVNEGAPAIRRGPARRQQPVIRSDARAIQITRPCRAGVGEHEPAGPGARAGEVSARPAVDVLMAYADAGEVAGPDAPCRRRRRARLDRPRRPLDALRALCRLARQAGRARGARRRGQRHRPLLPRRHPRLPRAVRSRVRRTSV